MHSEALHITLELVRAVDAGDAHAAARGAQEYLLRLEGGGYRDTELAWNRSLRDLLDRVRRPGRDPDDVARLGQILRDFVAPADWAATEARVSAALAAERPVVLTVRSAAAELYELPFELLSLSATGQHLGELPGMLVRYCWPQTQTEAESPAPRLDDGRVLLAWSSAAGGVPNVAHLEAITNATRRGQVPFDPERDVLSHCTLPALAAALADPERPPVSVLHLLAHGAEVGSSYGVAFDGEDGTVNLIDPGRLRQILGPHLGHVRLVVLAACDSANTGTPESQLGSLAQTLHRAGLQAVIASRFPLSVVGSNTLVQRLYNDLCVRLLSLEEAMRGARQALLAVPDELDWASVQLYARPEDGNNTRPLVVRPYRGLLPFGPEHTRFFFGRDAERTEIEDDLQALVDASEPRFVVVAGASGTGKSSVVLSGAVPDLTGAGQVERGNDRDVEDFERALSRLEAVAPRFDTPAVRESLGALRGVAQGLTDGGGQLPWTSLKPGSDPEAALLSAMARRKDPSRPFLLVVDQLEEIFTHGTAPSARDSFCQGLWSLARDDTGVRVICTIRVDFLGHCGDVILDATGLRLDAVAYDERHRVFVAQMGPNQLRQCIEAPARRVGLRLDDGLAESMLQDVGAEPGALPLLSYTLDLLWQSRTPQGTLSAELYHQLGGVAGALEKKADALIAELSEAAQVQARRLLVRLVGRGESGARDTRQRGYIDTIRPDGSTAAAAVFDGVLATLVDSRLLVQGVDGDRTTVEVSHEALIRKWSRLQDWVAEDREMLAELDEVGRMVQPWRDYGTLLDGDQLGYARQVAQRYPADISKEARELIDQSARQIAGRKRTRMAISLVVLAVVSSLAAAGFVLYYRAEGQREVAEAQRIEAEERRLEAEAVKIMAKAQTASVRGHPLAARQLMGRVDEPTERTGWNLDTANLIFGDPVPLRVLHGHGAPLTAIESSPDSELVLTAGFDGTARLWASSGRGEAVVLRGHTEPLMDAAFSADGQLVATGALDGTARLWELDGTPRATFEPDDDAAAGACVVHQVIFDPTGDWLLAITQANELYLFATDGSQGKTKLAGHTAPVSSASFSPDGRQVVTASGDRSVRLWDVATGRLLALLDTAGMGSTSVAFDPLGDRIVTGSSDRLRLFTLPGDLGLMGKAAAPRVLHPDHTWLAFGGVDTIAFSPNGNLVAALAPKGPVQLWALPEDPDRPRPRSFEASPREWFEGHTGRAIGVRFSPDGRRLLTYAEDQTVRLWDLTHDNKGDGTIAIFRDHDDAVISAAFSADGTRVLTASRDTTARAWAAQGRAFPASLEGSKTGVQVAAWTSDGATIIGINEGAEVLLWRRPVTDRPVLLGTAGPELPVEACIDEATDTAHVIHSDGLLESWSLSGGTAATPVRQRIEGLAPGSFDLAEGCQQLLWATEGGDSAVAPVADLSAKTVLTLPAGVAEATALSADGSWVAGIDDCGRPWAWAVNGSEGPRSFHRDVHTMRTVAFSPDGKTLTGTADPQLARSWSLESEEPYNAFRGHSADLTLTTLAPSGRFILTASKDGTARITQADGTGQSIVLGGHSGAVSQALFTADSTEVLTVDTNGEVRIWPVLAASLEPALRQARLPCPVAGPGEPVPACAPAAERVLPIEPCLQPTAAISYLGWTLDEAVRGWMACEQEHWDHLAQDPRSTMFQDDNPDCDQPAGAEASVEESRCVPGPDQGGRPPPGSAPPGSGAP